jgi:hypothetical protein
VVLDKIFSLAESNIWVVLWIFAIATPMCSSSRKRKIGKVFRNDGRIIIGVTALARLERGLDLLSTLFLISTANTVHHLEHRVSPNVFFLPSF